MRMWLACHLVNRIYPIHAVKDADGQYWKCTPDYEGGEVISYLIMDHNGNKYYCGEDELKTLGIRVDDSKTIIGFAISEDDKIQKI